MAAQSLAVETKGKRSKSFNERAAQEPKHSAGLSGGGGNE